MKRKEIEKFNKANGQQISNRPITKSNFDLNVIDFNVKSYKHAREANDIIGVAHHLGRILHAVLSCSVEHGLEMSPIFEVINDEHINFINNGEYKVRDRIKGALSYSIQYDGAVTDPNKRVKDIDVEVEKYVTTVVDCVANYFDVTVNSLCGESRKNPLPVARHLISYFCFERYISYSQFGPILTNIINRDRTTFIHGNKKITEGMPYDSRLRVAVKEIDDQIKRTLLQLNC